MSQVTKKCRQVKQLIFSGFMAETPHSAKSIANGRKREKGPEQVFDGNSNE